MCSSAFIRMRYGTLYDLNSRPMYCEPYSTPLTLYAWECMSTILLRSNANDFRNKFHRVGSKVARAAGKIIRVVVFARLK